MVSNYLFQHFFIIRHTILTALILASKTISVFNTANSSWHECLFSRPVCIIRFPPDPFKLYYNNIIIIYVHQSIINNILSRLYHTLFTVFQSTIFLQSKCAILYNTNTTYILSRKIIDNKDMDKPRLR